jgi:hypothetical protein
VIRIVKPHRWIAAAIAVALPLAPAAAQEPAAPAVTIEQLAGQFVADPTLAPTTDHALESTVTPEAAPANLIADPQVQPVAGAYSAWDYETGQAPVMVQQPVNWISGPYLKAGFAIAMGDDLLESQDGGYTISGGYRMPLSPALDERLFLDLGGSYLSAFGRTRRTFDVIETVRNPAGVVQPDQSDVFSDAFESTLKEIRRAGANLALGWYWGNTLDNRTSDPQLRVATRIGGRLSHVHGVFREQSNLPANLDLNPGDMLTDDGVGGFVGNTRSIETLANYKTDTVGGLFLGTEIILLARDTTVGSTAWTLDGEFANDWIEFDGWGRGSLGTASISLGFMLSR